MARVSVKENKNIYHKTRESLQLTRESASELLESITAERIEKIELFAHLIIRFIVFNISIC